MDEFQQDFANADSDHDGYLNQDEFYEMFKKYDPDFYIGSAGTIISQFNYNGKNPDLLSLEQATEYYKVFTNKIHFLFEIKYYWLAEVQQYVIQD